MSGGLPSIGSDRFFELLQLVADAKYVQEGLNADQALSRLFEEYLMSFEWPEEMSISTDKMCTKELKAILTVAMPVLADVYRLYFPHEFPAMSDLRASRTESDITADSKTMKRVGVMLTHYGLMPEVLKKPDVYACVRKTLKYLKLPDYTLDHIHVNSGVFYTFHHMIATLLLLTDFIFASSSRAEQLATLLLRMDRAKGPQLLKYPLGFGESLPMSSIWPTLPPLKEEEETNVPEKPSVLEKPTPIRSRSNMNSQAVNVPDTRQTVPDKAREQSDLLAQQEMQCLRDLFDKYKLTVPCRNPVTQKKRPVPLISMPRFVRILEDYGILRCTSISALEAQLVFSQIALGLPGTPGLSANNTPLVSENDLPPRRPFANLINFEQLVDCILLIASKLEKSKPGGPQCITGNESSVDQYTGHQKTMLLRSFITRFLLHNMRQST